MGLITDQNLVLIETRVGGGGVRVDTFHTPVEVVRGLLNSGRLAHDFPSWGSDAHLAALDHVAEFIVDTRVHIKRRRQMWKEEAAEHGPHEF
jgi:hypothetical protein